MCKLSFQQIIFLLNNRYFILNIPLNYSNKEYSIKVVCEKDSIYTDISNITSNLSLPKEFHSILQNNFGLANWVMHTDYKTAYGIYKDLKFQRTDFIEYKKASLKNFFLSFYMFWMSMKMVMMIYYFSIFKTVCKIMTYMLCSKEAKREFHIKIFFDKPAFFGSDKTGKYLITGVSDSKKRTLYKNKIVKGKLISIDKCTENLMSDKLCW